jgi:hypothetical protein
VLSVVLLVRDTGLSHLLTPNLLMGGKEADLMIRGNVQHVISTLYIDVVAGINLHQLSVNPTGLRPSRTVLCDNLRFLYAVEWYVFYSS